MGVLSVRSVLVTGANRGIGLGFVQNLLALPNPPEVVFAACRDPKGQRAQELQKLASKHRNLVIVPLELTDPASIKAAAASVGEHLKGSGLNLLINNAGILRETTLDTETLKDMSDVYATNTIGPLLLSQAALNMLTRCLSLGYREHSILCVGFHPGWVQTDMGNAAGYTAPLTVDVSVGGMLKVLSTLSEKDTGTFLDWEGNSRGSRRNMGVLSVRSALVTGANQGIGLGFVQHLLALPNPPEVLFAACQDPKGQRAQELQKLASKHRNLVIVPLELTDPASIKAAAASVGEHLKGSGLNLLINNAGILRKNTLDNETPKDMSEVYATNTIGPLLLSQALLPLLKKAAQGSPVSGLSCNKAAIVNISSSGGSIKEIQSWEVVQAVSYRCSKAALNMVTRCLSLGYREHGILCVSFHPGWVKTDMGNIDGYTPGCRALPGQPLGTHACVSPSALQAQLTVDESVGGMLKVLSSLSEKDTGTFLDWEGNVLPW
ncbi:hypothetical protein ASZ78_009040 [Callipepla squamata]|uniref:C-factor-like n=1 Tax=Callipepla squamata TaxID=9009 RepID=A0A226MT34_CALSU|nr:hypothetical protein ASZ78_009040 [Callipepla squamata]